MQEKVLAAIESGALTMKPKWRFAFHATLVALGGVILLLLLVYVVSFALFTSRQSGIGYAAIFGLRGWLALLRSLPWVLIVLSLLFIGVLEVLVRRYSFAYRQPLLFSAIGIILIVLFGANALSRTTFHPRVFRYAEQHRLPFAGGFYRGFSHPRLRAIHPGIITAVTSDGFLLMSADSEPLRVIVDAQTRFPFGDDVVTGDRVVVFGDRTGDTIRAFGMRKIMRGALESPMGTPSPRVQWSPR